MRILITWIIVLWLFAKNNYTITYLNSNIELFYNDTKYTSSNININPSNSNSYLELALIFHSQNDTTAIEYYNTILTIDSNDIIVLYNLALFYQENEDYNNSLETYSKILKIDNFNANVYLNNSLSK